MKNRSYFRCPNALLRDDRLTYAARRVGAVLFAFSNAGGTCRKSYRQIARLAGVSASTAASAVRALAAAGYLTFTATRRYCKAIRGVGYGRNAYALNLSVLEQKQGYTRVRRDVFRYELTDSAFIIFLVIMSCQGKHNRMWPSIKKLQKATGAGCSTICAGLKLLKKLPTLIVQLFRKENGAFAANTYKPAAGFISTISCAADGMVTADNGRRSLPRWYSAIKRLLLQRVERVFSVWGVLRNLPNKDITYSTLRFTRGKERRNTAWYRIFSRARE